MRACTQFGELALLVEADVLTLARVFLNKFNLVDFAEILIICNRLFGSHFKMLKGKVLLDDFFHLRLDFFKVFGSEGAFNIKIIIEPILN